MFIVRVSPTENANAKERNSRTNCDDAEEETQEPQESQQLSAGEYNGREPMTGAQAAYLQTLADEAREPGAYRQGLTRREASKRIEALMERLRLGELPPHTD